jgi:dTDP-4-dehydrorhamnose reductase
VTTRLLVTGGSGQVGAAVVASLAGNAAFAVSSPQRAEFDLNRPDTLAARLDALSPAIVVHCGAYTAVDRAEEDVDTCMRVNTTSPTAIARWCAAHGAAMLHLSTDYVFDGMHDGPYLEDAPTSPLQEYGRAKRDAEVAVLASLPAAVIFRVAGVYDGSRKNFLTAILSRARSGQPLTVVADQVTAPTSAASIAAILAEIVQTAVRDPRGAPAYIAERRGIVHAASAGAVSWFEFARALLARAARNEPALRDVVITPTTAAAYGAPAPRPATVILGGSRLTDRFGITRTSWETQLDALMATHTH